ncbi:DNA replication initiation complex subunit, GINS15 family [Candidatus Nanobsidianus stetteri]|uniref:DNA replication initiation complex subunit, GINS15 family n=1 Tax=Nanobsidianus stetteri TaxID=1294122 RepID=R1FTE2_NANST|nr:DNA replication initiation complex subunit, GINS15 family [Candidatus Nanobsidianus stetteri]
MDISDIITYLQKEKERKTLQNLQKDFYVKVSELLKKYKKQLEAYKSDSKEYREVIATIDRLKESLSELINIRISKIINNTVLEVKEDLNIISEDFLEEEEKLLYTLIKKILKSYKENIQNKIINGEEIDINKFFSDINMNISLYQNKIDKKIVIIKNQLPKIVGPNGKIYGPFKVGDIIILNNNFAEKLENTGIGKIVN